jgi:hypothetical protein
MLPARQQQEEQLLSAQPSTLNAPLVQVNCHGTPVQGRKGRVAASTAKRKDEIACMTALEPHNLFAP